MSGLFAAERRALRMVQLKPRPFWIGTAAWLVFFLYPLVPGSLLRGAYSELQGHGLTGRFVVYSSGLVVAEAVMATVIAFGHAIYMSGFEAIESLVRANVLHARLASSTAARGPRDVSSGDAVTRLRDDPKDMLMLVDNWVDVLGAVGFGAVALVQLGRVDAIATAVMILPMVLFGFVNRALGHRLRRLRSTAREATSDATDFLNATIGATLTVKVTGAQNGVLHRIDQLNNKRSVAMVADQTGTEALWALNSSVGDVCIGVALIVAARRVSQAGDVALFATYAINLIWLPQKIGGAIVGRRRFEVAAKRIDALLPSVAAEDPALVRRPLPIHGGPPAPGVVRPPRQALDVLDVRGLTVHERGLVDVSFTLHRGTLTVITGPVGSGKSSLLRALTGQLDIDAGTVSWNGVIVEDRASFFVPPQCATVSQVPHLFSETLRDNLLLGAEADPTEAIRLAAFDVDVAQLPAGLATPIGAGGVRLSGGQAQRAAAARALVHDAELIVLDDLSSALDVETEALLWERLAASGRTVLAVSNRPLAIAKADQVIALTARSG